MRSPLFPPALCCCFLLCCASAHADDEAADPDPSVVASQAFEVVQEYCAQTSMNNVTAAAKAVSEVTDIWDRVNLALRSTRKVYLLYWRGVLAQCLNREDAALSDLHEFMAARSDSSLFLSLVEDARRRVRRLERKPGMGGTNLKRRRAGLIALGAGFSAGAVTFGVLGGWQWQQGLETQTLLTDVVHERADILSLKSQMEGHAQATTGLVSLAIGMGVASTATWIVTAVSSGSPSGRLSQIPIPSVMPLEQGAVVSWGVQW